MMNLVLPFTPGDNIFLIKEVKRGDEINYQFEIHTCEELRIKIVNSEGLIKPDIEVKLENTKPLYEVSDCFLTTEALTNEVERRRKGEPQPPQPSLLVASEVEDDSNEMI